VAARGGGTEGQGLSGGQHGFREFVEGDLCQRQPYEEVRHRGVEVGEGLQEGWEGRGQEGWEGRGGEGFTPCVHGHTSQARTVLSNRVTLHEGNDGVVRTVTCREYHPLAVVGKGVSRTHLYRLGGGGECMAASSGVSRA